MKFWKWIKATFPVAVALTALIMSMAYIFSKITSDIAYRQKWDKDSNDGLA